MKKVYLSGPYTIGDVETNVRNAINQANKLMDAGFSVFVPHLYHFMQETRPRSWNDWMELELVWLPSCDMLLRIPGESKGADIEVAEAKKLNIPVYYSAEEMIKKEQG